MPESLSEEILALVADCNEGRPVLQDAEGGIYISRVTVVVAVAAALGGGRENVAARRRLSRVSSLFEMTPGSEEIDPAELRRRARAVVDARYMKNGSWDDLKDAIADLAGLVGGGEISGI